MKKLSKHWYANKKSLKRFLNEVTDPPLKKALVQAWLQKITRTQSGDPQYEKNLSDKLDLLEARAAAAADPTGVNRSAKLLRLVQRVAKKGQPKEGIEAVSSDIWPPEANTATPPPIPVREYFAAAADAVFAAQQFIRAIKNQHPPVAGDPPGIGLGLDDIEAALAALLEQSLGEIDQELWERVDGIRAEMKAAILRGAAGEGSAFWPSTWVSSSSGG